MREICAVLAFVCCMPCRCCGPVDFSSLIKLTGPSCRLAARGLEQDPNDDSCSRYISIGVGEVAQIVAKLDETIFFNTLASYKEDYQEVRAFAG